LTGALSAITSGINNMSIKLSGGYTDNEYADALMREHRAALAKQGLTKRALIDLPHLPGLAQGGFVTPRFFAVDKPTSEAEAETAKAAFAATLTTECNDIFNDEGPEHHCCREVDHEGAHWCNACSEVWL
jgi:hypothetical protein